MCQPGLPFLPGGQFSACKRARCSQPDFANLKGSGISRTSPQAPGCFLDARGSLSSVRWSPPIPLPLNVHKAPVQACPPKAALARGSSCFRSQISPAAQLLSCSFRRWPFPWDEVPGHHFAHLNLNHLTNSFLSSLIQPHHWYSLAEMRKCNV